MNWFTNFFVAIGVGIASLFGVHYQTSTTAPAIIATSTGGSGIAASTTSTPVTPAPITPPPSTPAPAPRPPVPVAPIGSIAPTILSMSPRLGLVGSTVVIHGSNFLSTNTVLFGGGPINNVASTNNGTVLTFTVPSSVGADCKANEICPMYARLITAGTYTVVVRNANGVSNALQFSVTGGGVVIPPSQPATFTPPPTFTSPPATVTVTSMVVTTTPASTIGIVNSSFNITPPSSSGGGASRVTLFSGSFTVSSGNNSIYISKNSPTALTIVTNIIGATATINSFQPSDGTQSIDSSAFYTIPPASTRTFTFSGILTNTTGSPASIGAGISSVYLTTDQSVPQQIPINYSLQGLNSDFHIQVLLGTN